MIYGRIVIDLVIINQVDRQTAQLADIKFASNRIAIGREAVAANQTVRRIELFDAGVKWKHQAHIDCVGFKIRNGLWQRAGHVTQAANFCERKCFCAGKQDMQGFVIHVSCSHLKTRFRYHVDVIIGNGFGRLQAQVAQQVFDQGGFDAGILTAPGAALGLHKIT